MALGYRTSTQTISSANPVTLSVTVQSGDCILVVGIVGPVITARTGGAPTRGSQTFTQVGSAVAGTAECNSELWYIINPTVGTADVSVPNTLGLNLRTMAHIFTGSGASLFSSTSTGTSVDDPSLTINNVPAGGACIDVFGSGHKDASTASDTGIYANDEGAYCTHAQYGLNASLTNQTFTWTTVASDDVAFIMAAFEEVAAETLTLDKWTPQAPVRIPKRAPLATALVAACCFFIEILPPLIKSPNPSDVSSLAYKYRLQYQSHAEPIAPPAEAITLDKWEPQYPNRLDPAKRPFPADYTVTPYLHDIPVPPADKWFPAYPDRLDRARGISWHRRIVVDPVALTLPTLIEIDKWQPTYPDRLDRAKRLTWEGYNTVDPTVLLVSDIAQPTTADVQLSYRHRLQYQSYAELAVPAAVETITLDKWYPTFPDRLDRAKRILWTGWYTADPSFVNTLDQWTPTYPDRLIRAKRPLWEGWTCTDPSYVSTLDRWPPVYPNRLNRARNILWDGWSITDPSYVNTLDRWLPTYPDRLDPAKRVRQSEISFHPYPLAEAPETITVDKWFTQHQNPDSIYNFLYESWFEPIGSLTIYPNNYQPVYPDRLVRAKRALWEGWFSVDPTLLTQPTPSFLDKWAPTYPSRLDRTKSILWTGWSVSDPVTPTLAESISIDKWLSEYPIRLDSAERHFWSGWTVIDPSYVNTLDRWIPTYPSRLDPIKRPLREGWITTDLPRVITSDRWYPTFPDRLNRAKGILWAGWSVSDPISLTLQEPISVDKWFPTYPNRLDSAKRSLWEGWNVTVGLNVPPEILTLDKWQPTYPNRLDRSERVLWEGWNTTDYSYVIFPDNWQPAFPDRLVRARRLTWEGWIVSDPVRPVSVFICTKYIVSPITDDILLLSPITDNVLLSSAITKEMKLDGDLCW